MEDKKGGSKKNELIKIINLDMESAECLSKETIRLKIEKDLLTQKEQEQLDFENSDKIFETSTELIENAGVEPYGNEDIDSVYEAISDLELEFDFEREETEQEIRRKGIIMATESNRVKKANLPKKNRTYMIVNSVIILLFLLIAAWIGYYFISEKMPNYQRISFFELHPDISGENINIIFNSELNYSDDYPILNNGKIYLDVEFVKENIDEYIYWDADVERLTITTSTRVIQMNSDKLDAFVNNEPFKLNVPVLKRGGNAYIPPEIMEEYYNFSAEYSAKYNLAIVTDLSIGNRQFEVTKDTTIRIGGDDKEKILDNIKKGDLVQLTSAEYNKEDKYINIVTESGVSGFALLKYLNPKGYKESVTLEEPEITYPMKNEISGKISMLWDQVTTLEASQQDSKKELHDGLEVISPTWFSFDREEMNGDIINIVDKSYVDWAHENNYQVWPIITDNFDGDVSSLVLSDTETREKVIKQILSFVSIYELDGINIDFEMVRIEDAENYIQFLRELYPMMKLMGVTLSVDMYVPKPYNLYYNRTEVAKTSDYIVIMGYDEHHASSEVSGPVASIGFVDEGISETLKETTKQKLILGVPFYTRVWREELQSDNTIKVTSKAYGMSGGKQIFDDAGAEFEWLDDIGCFYAEFETTEDEKKITYKIWQEDEKSLEEKLKLVKKYGLAGVAAWKRGLEKEGIWAIINEYTE